MKILLIFISLNLFGCKSGVNWNDVERVYFFEQRPENFKSRASTQLIQLPEAKELNVDMVKNRLQNSQY